MTERERLIERYIQRVNQSSRRKSECGRGTIRKAILRTHTSSFAEIKFLAFIIMETPALPADSFMKTEEQRKKRGGEEDKKLYLVEVKPEIRTY